MPGEQKNEETFHILWKEMKNEATLNHPQASKTSMAPAWMLVIY